MSDQQHPVQTQPAPARSVGAGLAYALLIAILIIAALAIWSVLKACGFQLLGRTLVFPWCQEPPAIVRDLTTLEERNRLLQSQIHDAQLALMTPDACGPVVDRSPPPDPIADPVPDPIPEPDPISAPEPAPPPEPTPIDEASYNCAPDQVLQRPSEVAIVLDGSGSMEFSVDVPEQLEAQYLEAWRAANSGPPRDLLGLLNAVSLQERVDNLDRQLSNYPGRSRMSVARDVFDDAVGQAPTDIAVDLTYFRSCTDITSNSYGQDRAALQRAISGVQPGTGTPLAQAMRVAAGNIAGGNTPDEPVNMVIVTDGNDSCGGDPCATARRLAQQKPGLVINVVDLSQSDMLNCVSDATGGTYRRSRGADAGELFSAIQEAAGYSGAGQCRPAISE